jgi:hypothetical protein
MTSSIRCDRLDARKILALPPTPPLIYDVEGLEQSSYCLCGLYVVLVPMLNPVFFLTLFILFIGGEGNMHHFLAFSLNISIISPPCKCAEIFEYFESLNDKIRTEVNSVHHYLPFTYLAQNIPLRVPVLNRVDCRC